MSTTRGSSSCCWLIVLLVTALATAGCGSSSSGHGISSATTCQEWLSSRLSAQVAFIQAGTDPTVSVAFARVAAQYGSAVCRDAPNSAVPSAEQMVNLATASGHTNLYGATRSGGAGSRRTGSPSAPSTDYRRFAVVRDGLVYFQAASGDVRCLYVPSGMTSVLGCAAKDLGQRVVVLSAARVQRAVERIADLRRGEMPVGSATFGQSALGSLFSCSNSRRALTCRGAVGQGFVATSNSIRTVP